MTTDTNALRDRFEGCLLGGAAGDALGYAIEFWGEAEIFSRFGAEGIQTLEQAAGCAWDGVAHFSDDTQMTLFTAAGIALATAEGRTPTVADILVAYQEWLGTQGDTSRMADPLHPKTWLYGEKALHALRAPGNTCLSALRSLPHGGSIERPANDSKGCGGVMRVAPVGLAAAVRNDVDALQLGAEAAALTHGHALGWLPAAFLADLVARLVVAQVEGAGVPRSVLLQAVCETREASLAHFAAFPAAAVLDKLVGEALELAEAAPVAGMDDLARVHRLGEGWVGEEALAIALYAAVAHVDDVAAALRCAVNHKGDSDSTGAVAGNVLGALYGRARFEQAFDLAQLEERNLIATVADQLLA